MYTCRACSLPGMSTKTKKSCSIPGAGVNENKRNPDLNFFCFVDTQGREHAYVLFQMRIQLYSALALEIHGKISLSLDRSSTLTLKTAKS